MSTTEWAWIQRYAQQMQACNLVAGETVVVLSETRSRAAVVDTARLAAQSLGAHVVDIVLSTQPNPGPLPIRSTGACQAIAGHRSAVAACATADFVVDCTVEGLLHSPELSDILAGGPRVLMISNEHPENVERWPFDPDLGRRVAAGVQLMSSAAQLRATSPAGTDITVDLAGSFVAGSDGTCTEPGSIAHWPGGLVLAFPAKGTVNGTVVLSPGDVNLTFKEYVRDQIALTFRDDFVVSIEGSGLDAALFESYLAAFGEPEAYAVSHVGWGMNPGARWEAMVMFDKGDHNGTEIRAFAGNFLISTGANEVAGRFCRGHFDLPMRNHTVELDGHAVVTAGALHPDLA